MQTQLQIAFTEADQMNNDLRVKKNELKQILLDDSVYQDIVEKEKALKDKKKQILESVAEAYPKLVDEIEHLKNDLKLEKETMADMALREIAKGDTVIVEKENGQKYVPVFSVKWVKEEGK